MQQNSECIVIGCPNYKHQSSARYYKLPIIESLRQQWYSNTLREDLVPDGSHYVCHEHFDVDSFEADETTLRPNAIPSLFELEVFQKMLAHQDILDAAVDGSGKHPYSYRLSQDGVGVLCNDDSCLDGCEIGDIANSENKSMLINKPPPDQCLDSQLKLLKCSIMGCSNHYMPKRRGVPLFNLPRDEVLAKHWLKACKREDVQFKSYTRFRMCKNHFQGTDFDSDNNLKPNAIPSMFSSRSLDMQIHLRNMNLRKRKEKIVEDENEVYSTNKILPAHLSKRIYSERSKLASRKKKAQQAAEWRIAYENMVKRNEIKKEPLELEMTCEDDGLSQSQIAVLQSQIMTHPQMRSIFAADGLSMDWLLSQTTVSQDVSNVKNEPSERSKRPSLFRSESRYSKLQGLRRPRRRRSIQKVIVYVRPKATAKASIPFLEPAFKEQRRPYSKNLCVPRLKPGAVRTREEGLEIHLERTFRTTLKKYYDRKWCMHEPQVISNPASCQCFVCDEIIADNISLASHLCNHIEKDNDRDTEIDLFDDAINHTTCSICHQSFNTPFDMILHYDISHIHDKKEYQCRICEQKHTSLLELAAHLNLCHCGLEMPYRCEQCEFRTSFYVDALHHIATFHRGLDKFFCPFCLNVIVLCPVDNISNSEERTVLNSTAAYSHLIQHYDKIDGTKYISSKCKHCRKCVLHLKMIKDHIRRDHPNIVAGAKASYFSDDEVDEKYLIASGAITALSANDIDEDMLDVSSKMLNVVTENSTQNNTSLYNDTMDGISDSRVLGKNKKRKYHNNDNLIEDHKHSQKKLLSENKEKHKGRGRPRKVPCDAAYFGSSSDDCDEIETMSGISQKKGVASKLALKQNLLKKARLRCIECGKMLNQNDSHHFRSSRRCAFCPYTSCCSAAFAIHEQGHHEQTLYTLGECSPHPQNLYKCTKCGLETVDADIMAFHIATALIGGQPSDNSLAGSVVYATNARGQYSECAIRCICIPL